MATLRFLLSTPLTRETAHPSTKTWRTISPYTMNLGKGSVAPLSPKRVVSAFRLSLPDLHWL